MRQSFFDKLASDQKGFVTVLVPIFIIIVIGFILSQALIIASNKSIDDVNHIDSNAALYIAETGLEYAAVKLVSEAESGLSGDISSACTNLTSDTPIVIGRGKFSFQNPSFSSQACQNPSLECTVKVRSEVGRTTRVLQRTTCMREDLGDAGFGGSDAKSITMSIKNKFNQSGVAIFNLAWRIQGSEGQSTIGGASNAFCQNCVQPNPLWNLSSNTGGTVAAGSMGAAISVPARQTVSISQGINAKVSGSDLGVDRNYVQVGIVLPSLDGAITQVGRYFLSGQQNSTANNNASGTTNGYLPYPSATNNYWCDNADTLVMGISGMVATIGRDATFESITLDPLMQRKILGTESGYKARFPEPTTSDAAGDLVSEIYVLHNPRASLTAVSSSGNLITVQSTAGLVPGTVLRVRQGKGLLVRNTRVVSILSASQFQVDIVPSISISSGDAICGGICAFFDPNQTYTNFEVRTRNSSTIGQITQWAAGFSCFRGVDGSKIKPVRKAIPSFKNWQEVR